MPRTVICGKFLRLLIVDTTKSRFRGILWVQLGHKDSKAHKGLEVPRDRLARPDLPALQDQLVLKDQPARRDWREAKPWSA